VTELQTFVHVQVTVTPLVRVKLVQKLVLGHVNAASQTFKLPLSAGICFLVSKKNVLVDPSIQQQRPDYSFFGFFLSVGTGTLLTTALVVLTTPLPAS